MIFIIIGLGVVLCVTLLIRVLVLLNQIESKVDKLLPGEDGKEANK